MPSPTTSLPVPGKESAPEAPTKKKPGMVVPVPVPRQNAPSKHREPLEDRDAAMEANSSKNSTKTSSLDSGIEDGKTTPTSVEEKVLFQVLPYPYTMMFAPVIVGLVFFVHNKMKVVETPEREQPPSLPKPEVGEEQVHIIIGSEDPNVPKTHGTPKESSNVADDTLKTQSTSDSPAPTPSPSSDTTPVTTPRAGQNGSLSKGLPERSSMGGTSETSSPYVNGGIFSKRYSYASSMASESMDLSINRENMSLSSRVSKNVNNMIVG